MFLVGFVLKFQQDGANNFKNFLNCIFANKECCGSKKNLTFLKKLAPSVVNYGTNGSVDFLDFLKSPNETSLDGLIKTPCINICRLPKLGKNV
jgi:hypothetical protein